MGRHRRITVGHIDTSEHRIYRWLTVCRMNKFLLLVRRYLFATFQQMAAGSWGQEARINEHLTLLKDIPLNPADPKIPNGMRYHVIDIYIDELDRIDENRGGSMPLETMLEPLKTLKSKSRNKAARERVTEALADERLSDWQRAAGDDNGDDGASGE